ncbi:methyltransferase domain-containing protein [Fulvivirga sp. M361]|uniref:methyltransferase domain-containing protein n=1 Tax=Fulvivirga sp. M361 TaxID=2594266 RepID=UPI00162699CB|nr:methyltransferase domain-containing protein [Fulvivirga sp. M361]
MPDFSKRSTEQEWMDDLNSSGEVIDQTLRELEIINRLLGGNEVTTNGLKKLIAGLKEKPKRLKIVDLGCGGGDMLIRIAKWGRKSRIDLELIGIDANPHIVAYAERNTAKYPEISYKAWNIFGDKFNKLDYDVMVSTLFTHHFTDEQLVTLFDQCCDKAKKGIVINDIHRHWFAYYSIKWLTTWFSKSDMVKNDAAVSVLRSFHREGLRKLFRNAPYRTLSIQWKWAFRWQLVVWK